MAVTTSTRKITFDEAIAEMDRRGKVIETLERELNEAVDSLKEIDAVGCDFGFYEQAAKTMQAIARKALWENGLG